MTAPEANRYVDLDLRVDPTLISYAITYAKQYEGEWEPMIAARELAWGTGNLPLPVARMVLNCARSDARCALDLPKPRSRTFVGPFPAPIEPEDIKEPEHRTRRLRLVDRKPERQPRNLISRWKLRYGRSGTKTGGRQRRVWHALDPERSRIGYFPLAEPDHRFSALIYWVCGASSREPVLLGDPPDDLPMCKSCQNLLEADEYAEYRPELRSWWLDEQERLTDPNKER